MWARKSSVRGASNSREITICGTPGSARICVCDIFATVCSFLKRNGHSTRLVCVIGLRTVLQLREQRVEPLVAFVPVLAVAGQPHGRLAQRLCLEVAEASSRSAAARDQP